MSKDVIFWSVPQISLHACNEAAFRLIPWLKNVEQCLSFEVSKLLPLMAKILQSQKQYKILDWPGKNSSLSGGQPGQPPTKDEQLLAYAKEIRFRAERKAGEMLRDMDLKAGNPQLSTERIIAPKPKLSDMGISLNESSNWQRIALHNQRTSPLNALGDI